MSDIPCASSKPGATLRSVIGILYLLGCFTVFFLILTGRTDPTWKDVANMIVGSFITQVAVIIGYYYNSSQSSDRKTEIMADTAKAAAVTTTETAKVLATVEATEKK